MKLLVLTSEPVSADQIRGALATDADLEKSEVMVVAPALAAQRGALLDVRRRRGDREGAGGRAPRAANSSNPKALRPRPTPARPIPTRRFRTRCRPSPPTACSSSRTPRASSCYREDVDHDELEIRFGLPVDQARLSA